MGACLVAACTAQRSEDEVRGRGPAPSRPGGSSSVVFGVVGEPATLDPYSALASDLTFALARPRFPSLFRFLPDGSTEPYLATSLDKTATGARVKLREARWSNGRLITARDVIASVARARSPSGFTAVTDARVSAPNEVVFEGRVNDWERALATVAFVLPGGAAKRSVSGGPFVLESYRPGLEVVYRRNRHWSGRRPELRRLKVQFVESAGILLGLLQRGRLDAGAPPSAVNLSYRLEARGISSASRLGWESVYLDLDGATLERDERVGLWRAVRRRVIERVFVRGDGRVSNTLHPTPGRRGATGPWRAPLGRASIPEEVVDISAPTGDELLAVTQRALYEQLTRERFSVDLVSIDPMTFYGRWDNEDPTDVAVRRSAGAPTARSDRSAFRELSALPLFHVETFVAWRPGVRGLSPNPTFDGPLWNAVEWSRNGVP